MKKNNVISIISCLIIITALVFAMLSDTVGPVVSSLVTTIITTIGSVVIWIQLKRTGIKDSADLIHNLNLAFLQSPGLMHMRDKLARTTDAKDFSLDGKMGDKDTTYDLENSAYDDSINIIEYLEFFENIAVMYQAETLSLNSIDECFGDMFFVAMNNPYIQNREIIPYKEHYIPIIKLYKVWYNFRKKNKLKMPYEETPLDYETLLKEEN